MRAALDKSGAWGKWRSAVCAAGRCAIGLQLDTQNKRKELGVFRYQEPKMAAPTAQPPSETCTAMQRSAVIEITDRRKLETGNPSPLTVFAGERYRLSDA